MTSLAKAARHYSRGETGAASLEAALVLPFVLVLGLGTIEFGWLMAQVQSIQTAVRDAARYASRSTLVITSGGGADLSAAIRADAEELIRRACRNNGINRAECDPKIDSEWEDNSNGAYLAGNRVYRLVARVEFTPASAGLLSLTGITIPKISLQYEVRHAGG